MEELGVSRVGAKSCQGGKNDKFDVSNSKEGKNKY
jgi:hypothetical protein